MSHTRNWPRVMQMEEYLYGFSMKAGGLWNWSMTVGLRLVDGRLLLVKHCYFEVTKM